MKPHSKDELQTSTAPKRTANQAAPANPGMHHVAIPADHGSPGLLAHGVSKTQAARLLGQDAIGEVHGGAAVTPPKRLGKVPAHPHASDAQRESYEGHDPAEILGEAKE
jgi:hypothetical protein